MGKLELVYTTWSWQRSAWCFLSSDTTASSTRADSQSVSCCSNLVTDAWSRIEIKLDRQNSQISKKHFISCLYVSMNSYGQYTDIDAASVFFSFYLYINDGDVPTVGRLVPSVLHYWHWCLRFQSWAFQHVASGFGELHWAHLSPSAASSSSLQYDFTKHKIHEGKFALAVCLCWFPQYKCVLVWDKWLTFVTSLRALQVCSSPLSSAPFATSWSLFLNVRWPVEHPVCGPREESKSKMLKKRRRRSMNHRCFDFIPFPSVADSISQLQLQTSQLSVSVLCWLSSELLCPVMPSQSKRRCSLLDHQSPSFAQSVFSPKSDKGQHTHKNIV